MNPLLVIFLIVATIVVIVKFFINPAIARRDAKKAQDAVDRNIEWQIMDGQDYVDQITVALLAKHSNKGKMASIMASRIREYLYMGAHPDRLSRLFDNLGLYDGPRKAEQKEIELSALIKHYVHQNIEVHELRCYQSTISSDKKPGLAKINKSFLVKAGDSMLVWSPSFN